MRFTIGKKIAIVFGVVFTLNVMAALFSYIQLSNLAKYQRSMNEISLPAVDASQNLRSECYRVNSAVRGLVFMGNSSFAGQFRSDYEAAWQNINANEAKLQDVSLKFIDPKSKERVAILAEDLPKWRDVQLQVLQAASSGGASKAFDLLMTKAAPVATSILQTNSALSDSIHKIMDERVQKIEDARQATISVLVLSTLFSIASGASLAFFITRKIVTSVHSVATRATAIAEGDLTGDALAVLSDDEVGELTKAVNLMQSNLTEIMRAIERDAENLASASEQLSTNATQLASGAQTQTDHTQQVATAIHQMSATVQEVSNNSTQAATKAEQTADTALKGGKVVEDVLATMRSIAESVGSTARKIEGLGRSSDKIGTIIAVIDEIADQTNLLALNAAIEAARAGEQGRGFAVVADEVRKLAERTTHATKEIAAMITTVQSETNTAVSDMELGTKKVDAGVETTKQAGIALNEIISGSQQVGDMISQIATAATEQASATDEIKSSIESIAQVTQDSASGAQQSARACQELSALVMNLQQVVNRFRISNQQLSQGRRPSSNKLSDSDSFESDELPRSYLNQRIM